MRFKMGDWHADSSRQRSSVLVFKREILFRGGESFLLSPSPVGDQ